MQVRPSERRARIEALVRYLCSPECAGRAPDTAGGIAARTRIVDEFRAIGAAPGGTDGFLQPVPGCGANVLAEIPGHGPLAEHTIVVAAHYDHLGSLGGDTFWGADDNAAAVAILVEVGRELLARRRSGRRVVLAAYDGEEPPHFLHGTMGSMYHVAHPTAPLAGIDMMVCMDLCGHALGPVGCPSEVRDSVFVLGAELSHGTGELVDAAAIAGGIYPRRADLDVIPPLSDYQPFREAGVPVLFLSCGRWEHYHQPTDTPDRLDYDKIVSTVEYLAGLVQMLRERPDAPTFDTHARDDLATIASLRTLARHLAPRVPAVSQAAAHLDALAAAARTGPLSQPQRQQLAWMVAGLEDALS
ncbi:M28 family peptidase [Nannocystis bainbridge]|uniref:M28 family peptidase n=1 Tax=Nannocystis bainbridge TaxID=2995303 RepID=A0ABT5DXJ8_9BACT|nr:M28 family peptidase [Nannocystis bainbridge]MDC0718361.1 M28 family peptidase [Nannocystis bainbridge]